MPQWNLNVTPGGATGGLSAPQIGGGAQNWGPLMDMLKWRMQMQQNSESARLDAIKQQMKMAKEQYRAQKRARGKAGQKTGLGRADTSKIDDYMKAWRMSQAMLGPGTLGALGSQNPLEAQQLTGMIGAIGPQAAHEGMMQTGRLQAGMAGSVAGAARYPRRSTGKSLGEFQGGTIQEFRGGVMGRVGGPGAGYVPGSSGGPHFQYGSAGSGQTTPLGPGTNATTIIPVQPPGAAAGGGAPTPPAPAPGPVPAQPDGGGGFEAILNPQSANLGLNVPPGMQPQMAPTAPGMQPGGAPPMAPTAPAVQPRPGQFSGGFDPAGSPVPGARVGGDTNTGLRKQQQAQGFLYGGGVPETGTYKLHEGEIEIDPDGGMGRIPSTDKYKVPAGAEIIPTKLADVLMPSIAASRKSKGKAKRDYQKGTTDKGMLEMLLAAGESGLSVNDMLEAMGIRDPNLNLPQGSITPSMPGAEDPAMLAKTGLGGLPEVSAPMQEFQERLMGTPYYPGQIEAEPGPLAGAVPPAPAVAPGTQTMPAPPPELGIPGLGVTQEAPIPGGAAEAAGQETVSKYTLQGKPETPAEQQQRELDTGQRDIDRHKEKAQGLESSAARFQRWAMENPNKPSAKTLWAQSKELAAQSKQAQSVADSMQKNLDARREVITQAETEREIGEIQAGGYVGSAQIKAAGEARKEIEGRSQESLERSIEWYRGEGDDPELAAKLELLQMWRNDPELYDQFKAIAGGTGLEQF